MTNVSPFTSEDRWIRPPYTAVATVYDKLMGEVFEHRQTRLIASAQNFLGLTPPGVWMDMACGSGEVAGWLAEGGWTVKAGDLSQPMLDVAMRKAQERGWQIDFTREDMRRWKTSEPCDVVSCFFDSLNILTRKEDLVKAFRSARRALAPGGYYLFDAVTPYQTSHMWEYCDQIHEGEGFLGVWDIDKNPSANVIRVRMRWFILNDEGLYYRCDEVHKIRGYSLDEIKAALAEGGLEFVEAYDGDQDFLAPAEETTMRIDYIARRPE